MILAMCAKDVMQWWCRTELQPVKNGHILDRKLLDISWDGLHQGSKTPTSPDSSRSCTPSAANHFRSGTRRRCLNPNFSSFSSEISRPMETTWQNRGYFFGEHPNMINMASVHVHFECFEGQVLTIIDLSRIRIPPYRLPSSENGCFSFILW